MTHQQRTPWFEKDVATAFRLARLLAMVAVLVLAPRSRPGTTGQYGRHRRHRRRLERCRSAGRDHPAHPPRDQRHERTGQRRAGPVPHRAASHRRVQPQRRAPGLQDVLAARRGAEHRRRPQGGRAAGARRRVRADHRRRLGAAAEHRGLDGRDRHHQPADQGPAAQRPRLPAAGLALLGHAAHVRRRHQHRRTGGEPGGLPARRPGQQQPADLHRTFRAEGSGQTVGGCDSGVQGRHQRLCRRVWPLVVRRRERVAQVRHQLAAGHRLRVLPSRGARRQELLRHREAAVPAQPVRRRGWLSAGPQPHLLLR